jgi:serine protease AprX
MVIDMTLAKILLKKAQQKKIREMVDRVVESYDNFALVDASDEQIASIKKEGYQVIPLPLDQMGIKIGSVTINTGEPRIDRTGAVKAHPAYAHQEEPDADKHHYIVQLIGPTKEEWKEEIIKNGGTIKDPLPSYSFMVEMDAQALNKVSSLPFVHWIGHYDPSYRLAANLMESIALQEGADSGALSAIGSGKDRGRKILHSEKAKPIKNTFQIRFQSVDLVEGALSKIKDLGAQIHTEKSGRSITISFPEDTKELAEKLQQMASIHGVQLIDAVRVRQLRNNVASRIMTDSLGPAKLDLPFKGKGEIIAIADTGIDTGDPSTIHEDFRGRIAGITSWPITAYWDSWINNPGADDGPEDVDSGHGTHVAGSVLGNGKMSQGGPEKAICGLAPEASLFFQAVEQKMNWKTEWHRKNYGTYILSGIPENIGELFLQAYQAGARVHTNSWGGGDYGAYDEQSHDLDAFVWEHKDMVILFAAGNDGKDVNRDGKIETESITPPATAKNCIAVGASESLRTQFNTVYKDFDPFAFNKDPIAKDKVADNIEDVAAFSSRGPCLDGRFKPDVICPGTYILSTKSSRDIGENWKPFDEFYKYLGGTSMATPLAAGAIPFIKNYLKLALRRNPSAALIKAAMIHNALHKPYRYSALENNTAAWDPEQGWGHINLKPFLVSTPGWRMTFADIKNGLKTGESWTRSFSVMRTDLPLKITMVFTDFPAMAGNYPGLVNNLNLIVKAPDGKEYHGNAFAPPYDATLDGINNVESVCIKEPLKGRYKITVLADDVKEGTQDFAIVYSGGV